MIPLTSVMFAMVIVMTPVNPPTVDFANLPLDLQMAVIDVIRPAPAVVLPAESSLGRVVPTQQTPLPPVQVETLIRRFFNAEDVPWALRVSYCESGWNPAAKNPTSSASGLFQHLARFWDDRSARAGWPAADIFDPVANTAVAAWLYYNGGSGHWVCK